MAWDRPYSIRRLVKAAQSWDFRSEFDDWPDADDGAPAGYYEGTGAAAMKPMRL